MFPKAASWLHAAHGAAAPPALRSPQGCSHLLRMHQGRALPFLTTDRGLAAGTVLRSPPHGEHRLCHATQPSAMARHASSRAPCHLLWGHTEQHGQWFGVSRSVPGPHSRPPFAPGRHTVPPPANATAFPAERCRLVFRAQPPAWWKHGNDIPVRSTDLITSVTHRN